MTSKSTAIACCALVGALSVSAAFAHHGWTSYDESAEITVTGTITESNYRNPHATIRLEGDGKTWVAWLAPLRRMETRGLNKDLVQPGTTVTVVGYPSTVVEDEMRAERILIGDMSVELR